MAKEKTPNVVAELGRPETAAETAARKAENSRLYRERKTVNNLVYSLLVSVGLVAVIFLMVPRGTGDFDARTVDVAQEAANSGADRPLVVPDVPATWKAKQAKLSTDGDIEYWQIHYTTENEAYATVLQAYTTDGSPVPAKWISEQLEHQKPTGDDTLGGMHWVAYEHPERNAKAANLRFGFAGAHGGDTVLVYGTDTDGTIRVLTAQVADALSKEAQ